ncbi:hypothetical protein CRN75_10835 [Yersinia frederiksenii]|nr:hypothetical protein CRN75_10835 [Yersinia frederiksenii]
MIKTLIVGLTAGGETAPTACAVTSYSALLPTLELGLLQVRKLLSKIMGVAGRQSVNSSRGADISQ